MFYVDSREPDFVKTRVKRHSKDFVIKKLDAGDFMNEKETVALERKRPEDIWNRVFNKQWDRQMQDLQHWALEANTVPWLLVEGTFHEAHIRTRGKMPVEMCKGVVISAVIRYGIAVWYCKDLDDLIDIAIRMCKKADEGKLGLPKKIPFAEHVKDSRVGIIMNLCRISARQSRSLLKSLGTVEAVLMAPEKRLLRAEFVGPSTAKKVHRLLHTVYR